MPEFYKKAVAIQFLLTDQQKADVKAGKPVTFEGEPVKGAGTDRYHALIRIGDKPTPIYENQWFVRVPEQEILWDMDFKAKYIPVPPPQVVPPTVNQKSNEL